MNAAIVHLGRRSLGEARRVESWSAVLRLAGAEVVDVPLLGGRRAHLRGVGDVVRGDAVPESLAWSAPAVRARLDQLGPDLVVFVTARAIAPRLIAGPWVTAVDLVDRLGTTYAQRAAIELRWSYRASYRALAATATRVEKRLLAGADPCFLAGWCEAEAAGARWFPNVVPPATRANAGRGESIVFFGTLSYLPNIEAVERLERIWRLAGRPAPVIIAGRKPTARVRTVVARNGWTLAENFASIDELAAVSAIAIAPMTSVSGIQNKVIEAGSAGIAQVLTPAALSGLAPGFPAAVGISDRDLAERLLDLLGAPGARAELSAKGAAEVDRRYRASAWASMAKELVSGERPDDAARAPRRGRARRVATLVPTAPAH